MGHTICQLHLRHSPYFTPNPATLLDDTLNENDTTYTIVGDLGDVTVNHFYKIVATNCDGTDTAISNETGEFDFAITQF